MQQRSTIGIVGLGYVGLPLAATFTTAQFRVIGVDTDQAKIDKIKKGEPYIVSVGEKTLEEMIWRGFTASTDYTTLKGADAILIAVPTPLRGGNPDMSILRAACHSVAAHVRPGALVVVESTVYPGAMDNEIAPIFADNGVHLAFSPERENPGSRIRNFTIPKVVGANTDAERELAVTLYKRAFDTVVPVSSMAVAEASKIIENTFRAVNIGLVNEIKVGLGLLEIDVWEALDAAETKPFGFMRFHPGPGVGGHCIAVDPTYFLDRVTALGGELPITEAAVTVNERTPELIAEEIANSGVASVLALGVAYKENVGDVRESPALDVIDILQDMGVAVAYHDALVPTCDVGDSVPLEPEKYDAVVILTKHAFVDYEKVWRDANHIFDTRNVYGKPRERVTRL